MNLVQKLLELDKNKLTEMPTNKVEIPRLSKLAGEKFEVEVRGLDDKTYKNVQKISVTIKKGNLKNIDVDLLQDLSLESGIVDPDLHNKKLQEHLGAINCRDLVSKLFLPGEKTMLYLEINKLTGFKSEEEEEEDKDTIKN